MARKCFFSFHYAEDAARAAQVRSIGSIEGNRPASDNDWERVTRGGDAAIQRWIAGQLQGRSCGVVLAGSYTAGRKWVSYEISEAWNKGMGVVGIRIQGLKNLQGLTSLPGGNPFDHVTLNATGTPLSGVVKLYNPAGHDSKQRYAWISNNIVAVIEEAIAIRARY
jgi:hypothetical protein